MKWPKDWVPPYVVAWRVPWWLFVRTLHLGMVAGAFCGWGPQAARNTWRSVR